MAVQTLKCTKPLLTFHVHISNNILVMVLTQQTIENMKACTNIFVPLTGEHLCDYRTACGKITSAVPLSLVLLLICKLSRVCEQDNSVDFVVDFLFKQGLILHQNIHRWTCFVPKT